LSTAAGFHGLPKMINHIQLLKLISFTDKNGTAFVIVKSQTVKRGRTVQEKKWKRRFSS
jgi:hypothetical protein